MKRKLHIAIFASGAGSNAEVLMEYFRKSELASISLVLCNKKNAGVIERAERAGVPVELTSKEKLDNGSTLAQLENNAIDFVVLAGFLLKIPAAFIQAFPDRIINLHPSLLPKFGGKGMYGANVHKAVIEGGEQESGITIHLVNEKYDDGRILAQFTCPVLKNDTPNMLQARIHSLEHEHFAETIDTYLRDEF